MIKNKFFGQGLLIMLLLFLYASPVFPAQNIKIEIPEIIYTSGESFSLGQIAKISGGNIRTRKELSSIQVFADRNKLTRNEVLRAIEESDASDARIELYMPNFSRIETPDYEGNFTDTSNYQERTPASLVPIIKSLASWDGGLEVSATQPIPDGKLIDPASIIPGTQGAILRFQDSNGRIKSINVRMNWTQNVMIASRNIKKGDKITANNITSRQMKITKPGLYASTPAEIMGFTADRNIKQGEAIILRNLTSSNVVKKGRQVKIIARLNGITVTADGVLLEDGNIGEYVRVRRADDKKSVLRARIINENTVEVQVN